MFRAPAVFTMVQRAGRRKTWCADGELPLLPQTTRHNRPQPSLHWPLSSIRRHRAGAATLPPGADRYSADAHLIALLSTERRPWADASLTRRGGLDSYWSCQPSCSAHVTSTTPLANGPTGALSPLHRQTAATPPILLVCSSRRRRLRQAHAHDAARLGACAQVLPQDLSHQSTPSWVWIMPIPGRWRRFARHQPLTTPAGQGARPAVLLQCAVGSCRSIAWRKARRQLSKNSTKPSSSTPSSASVLATPNAVASRPANQTAQTSSQKRRGENDTTGRAAGRGRWIAAAY